ncbi:hypothetical protein BX661DRAFT_200578 [Kickxella alabastrina]|uniref:uncharacterized protein n=1 Tax=Kickxella alabastrina TaxID=61397 RepID=UPI00221F0FB4|nr:uncharacterized protein BX661DRAFT_200578 [Kickxella alabastrina]KAI7821818.1 hypothetical protein BX661DRAFT_200578 [Kickxella alabastrina]
MTPSTVPATIAAKKSLIIDYEYKTRKVTERLSSMGASEFMLTGGEGIYTAMRTISGSRRVFLLDDHLQRISDSHKMVLAADKEDGRQSPEHWRELLVPLIRRGLDSFGGGQDGDDRKITVLVGNDHISMQLTRIKSLDDGSCWVKFVSGKRDNPEAKNLQWVHERETLEKLIVPPINEVVLADPKETPGGRFYEGISSNFFTTRRALETREEDAQPEYRNYELVSAPRDSVLLGTIMKLVLRICERDNINVVYEPKVDFHRWTGAFVSSTSRLVLPVSRIITDKCEHHLNAGDPLVCHLKESVKSMAMEQSTEI